MCKSPGICLAMKQHQETIAPLLSRHHKGSKDIEDKIGQQKYQNTKRPANLALELTAQQEVVRCRLAPFQFQRWLPILPGLTAPQSKARSSTRHGPHGKVHSNPFVSATAKKEHASQRWVH